MLGRWRSTAPCSPPRGRSRHIRKLATSLWYRAVVHRSNGIFEFVAADDAIYLDRSIFTAVGTGALAASAFVAGTAAADAGDRTDYGHASGNIFYDADGTGAGAAVLFASVAAGTALTNADFIGFWCNGCWTAPLDHVRAAICPSGPPRLPARAADPIGFSL